MNLTKELIKRMIVGASYSMQSWKPKYTIIRNWLSKPYNFYYYAAIKAINKDLMECKDIYNGFKR